MPNYDGTGPEGKGPMTGCGKGYCVIPLNNSEQELDFLNKQERVLEAQLKQIKTRIKLIKPTKEVNHARI